MADEKSLIKSLALSFSLNSFEKYAGQSGNHFPKDRGK